MNKKRKVFLIIAGIILGGIVIPPLIGLGEMGMDIICPLSVRDPNFQEKQNLICDIFYRSAVQIDPSR